MEVVIVLEGKTLYKAVFDPIAGLKASVPDMAFAISITPSIIEKSPQPLPPDDMSINEKQAWKEGFHEGWLSQP